MTEAPTLSGEPTPRDCTRHTARLAEVLRDFLQASISGEDAIAELDKIIIHCTRHTRKETET